LRDSKYFKPLTFLASQSRCKSMRVVVTEINLSLGKHIAPL
jgi:hypothetical protein